MRQLIDVWPHLDSWRAARLCDKLKLRGLRVALKYRPLCKELAEYTPISIER